MLARAELNRLKKFFNDFSGECFFVYHASNFIVLTKASSALLLARTLVLL